MPARYVVQVQDVSADVFQEFKKRLAAYGLHDDQGTKLVATEASGVVATIEHDANGASLSVTIDRTPDIVTNGYILGFLYDTLLRSRNPAPAGAAAAG